MRTTAILGLARRRLGRLWCTQGGPDRDGGSRGLGSNKRLDSLTATFTYLQAMDEPGMNLLDQSVIKKGKEWRTTSRAEPGEIVQARGAQTHFLHSLQCLLCVTRLGDH